MEGNVPYTGDVLILNYSGIITFQLTSSKEGEKTHLIPRTVDIHKYNLILLWFTCVSPFSYTIIISNYMQVFIFE